MFLFKLEYLSKMLLRRIYILAMCIYIFVYVCADGQPFLNSKYVLNPLPSAAKGKWYIPKRVDFPFRSLKIQQSSEQQ